MQKHFLTALLGLTLNAQADTLSDFKTTLQRLQGDSPLKGQISVKSEVRSNEGKDDAETEQGLAALPFEDGQPGLRLQYPQTLLNKALTERQARDANPKAAAPTHAGLQLLEYNTVRELTRPAELLARHVQRGSFKGERSETWQGKPAKVLSFELPMGKPNKYVKSFENLLEVWVSPEGQPLAARSRYKVSGRAMMVFSFEQKGEDEWHFAVVGERLVALRKSSQSSGSGGGEKGVTKRDYTLSLS
jgi:hypothetical protein